MELAEHIAIESTGHRTPNYPNLTDSTLFFASGGRDVVRGSLTFLSGVELKTIRDQKNKYSVNEVLYGYLFDGFR